MRRLDADQGFRAPDTHDHFMETKLSRLDTTEEPARALWKHVPTVRRLDARQRFAAELRARIRPRMRYENRTHG